MNRVQPVAGAFDQVIDEVSGGVHCLDQLLFFKPWWLWEAEQNLENRLAEANMAKPNEEGDDNLKVTTNKRKVTDKPAFGRRELSSSDVEFRGEAEVDSAMKIPPRPEASKSDLSEEI